MASVSPSSSSKRGSSAKRPRTPSSQSNSPIPRPSSSSSSTTTAKSTPRRLTTLSKNALYTPLSSYLPSTEAGESTTTTTTTTADPLSGTLATPDSRGDREEDQRDAKTTSAATPLKPTKSLSKTVFESSLHAFLEQVSIEYHTSPYLVGCGNNGGKPLQKRQLEDKISQRSLTLIGGGIQNPLGGSLGMTGMDGITATSKKRKKRGAKARGIQGNVSNRKRKRRLSLLEATKKQLLRSQPRRQRNHGDERLYPVDSTTSRGDVGKTELSSETKNENKQTSQQSFVSSRLDTEIANSMAEAATETTPVAATRELLQTLNTMWNQYVQKLLLLTTTTTTTTTLNPTSKIALSSSDFVSLILDNMEFIGAKVQIIECKSHPHYIGYTGVIIDVTAQTWRLTSIKRNPKRQHQKQEIPQKDEEKATSGDHDKEKVDNDEWSVIIVPKKGSVLLLTVHIPEEKSSSLLRGGGGDGGDSRDDHDNAKKKIPQIPSSSSSSFNGMAQQQQQQQQQQLFTRGEDEKGQVIYIRVEG